MADTTKQCPKCNQSMEAGMRMDVGYGAVFRELWASKQNFDIKPGNKYKTVVWLFSNPLKKTLPVTTYRCTACGYLESYALPA